MIIFRPHRGSLYAAMAEAKEFSDVDEMKEFYLEVKLLILLEQQ